MAVPDWTAAAIRAATPARATVAVLGCEVWEVRPREEMLLNTDSFCMTAGRAARGDRTVGWDVRAELGGAKAVCGCGAGSPVRAVTVGLL
ncbi:hypothetical protein GCM10018980_75840 [Streptomyces capoamus]|uniref:Uncharacterized protein n=1 Tax=Streptomyces capoamus TaxID=68183 RepID=A0A919F3R9_9ACTN|nr:hypothetical protein GCM10018980_75840 [Streptomyces capoamus]